MLVAGGLSSRPTPALAEDADAGKARPLVVCALPAALPRTARGQGDQPLGLDVAVVRLVARRLGRPLEFHWCASAACSWNCLPQQRCDIVIGLPHGSGPSRDVAWSVPYSGSRFGLVVGKRDTDIRSHDDLAGKRVGIVAGSVSLPSKGHTTVSFKSRQDVLSGFLDKRLDAAFIDDDFAAWYLHRHPTLPLRRVREYVPRQRWNMAFAVRAKDKALLGEINGALVQVLGTGQVARAFARLGVSYRAPFGKPDRRKIAYDTWQRIRERRELVVSMDPANLPYSGARADSCGFDVEIARAVAKKLGVKLRINWIDVQRETAIGELLDGECDLAFGSAIDPNAVDDEVELASKVIYSTPYYGTGYLLVVRRNGPRVRSLAELKGDRSRRLGTDAGSVADYRLRQRGFLRRLYRTQLAVLKSLDDGDIDFAYVWANAGFILNASPDFKLELLPGYVPEDHWNIAIAMRRGDAELKRHIDPVISGLVEDGTIATLLKRYHVPYFRAFGKPAGAGVIRRGVSQRGLEPDMSSRQRSKRRYAGLERVRSAGVLVVGLDHNNLPFSSVHPKPAGLDYEVAGLLAKQLGVSLKVFWGYSSHDSYPSRLAARKLCDVMLGVMPDDRFGKRVLFSKPYYFAKFEYVLRSKPDGPVAVPVSDVPLAVERGVAVRGIRGRTTRRYPSLAAILEAVAGGRERAGYVISTHGHWLAETRWPRQLTFVDGRPSVDRFPICAAVRRADGDLKTAIDRAFEQLDRSGQLRRVFSRWHIPYDSPAEAGKAER